jgi:hypothetical protein
MYSFTQLPFQYSIVTSNTPGSVPFATDSNLAPKSILDLPHELIGIVLQQLSAEHLQCRTTKPDNFETPCAKAYVMITIDPTHMRHGANESQRTELQPVVFVIDFTRFALFLPLFSPLAWRHPIFASAALKGGGHVILSRNFYRWKRIVMPF